MFRPRRRINDDDSPNSKNGKSSPTSANSITTGSPSASASSSNIDFTVADLFHNAKKRLALRRLFKLPMWSICVLILASIYSIHRIYAHAQWNTLWVHAPIHTLPRTCPPVSYPTLTTTSTNSTTSTTTTTTTSTSNPKICLTTLTDEQEKSIVQKSLRLRNFDGLLQQTWDNKQSYANKHGYRLFDESALLDRSRPPSWSKILAAKRLLTEEDCDWVWWLDADTVIMNSNKRLEDFLPSEPNQDLLLSPDHKGFNAGGWVIHRSAWSLEFLDRWWNMKEYVKPPGLAKSGDQDALRAFLTQLQSQSQQKQPSSSSSSSQHNQTSTTKSSTTTDDFVRHGWEHILVPPQCTFNSFAFFLTRKDWEQLEKGGQEAIAKQRWYMTETFYHKGDLLAHVAGFNNKGTTVQMLLELAE